MRIKHQIASACIAMASLFTVASSTQAAVILESDVVMADGSTVVQSFTTAATTISMEATLFNWGSSIAFALFEGTDLSTAPLLFLDSGTNSQNPAANSVSYSADVLEGDYTFVFGPWLLTETEARTGIASTPNYGGFFHTNPNIPVTVDYRIEFVPIPNPATLGLLGLGLIGLAYKRRKKI